MSDQRFKIEKGIAVEGGNNIFTADVTVGGNTTVEGDLLLVKGNFNVLGDTVYSGTTYYDTDIIPLSNNLRLIGNPANTYVAYLGNTTISAFLNPSANGILLGNTSRRWEGYTTSIDATGQVLVGGNFSVNSNALTVDAGNKRVGINGSVNTTASLTVTGNTIVNGSINVIGGGSIVADGNLTVNGSATVNSLTVSKVALVSNSKTINSTTQTIVDTFTASSSRFGKVIITADNTTVTPAIVHAVEMMIIHDSSGNVLATKYGEVYNAKLGTFDASVLGSNINITFTATAANTANTITVKTLRQQILV